MQLQKDFFHPQRGSNWATSKGLPGCHCQWIGLRMIKGQSIRNPWVFTIFTIKVVGEKPVELFHHPMTYDIGSFCTLPTAQSESHQGKHTWSQEFLWSQKLSATLSPRLSRTLPFWKPNIMIAALIANWSKRRIWEHYQQLLPNLNINHRVYYNIYT